MTKLNAILIGLLLSLLVAVAVLGFALRGASDRCDRLSANQTALMDTIGHYRTANGQSALQIRRLTLTSQELRDNNAILLARINALGIRRRDIQAIQQTTTTYAASFAPDTVYVFDTIVAASRPVLDYSDRWLRFRMDTMAHISLQDTILIVHHARTRRFLWWTWRKYTGRATAVSSCPYAQIESLNAIDISR